MNKSNLVLPSSLGTVMLPLIFISYRGLTTPSILYTSDAVGSFFIFAAYLNIYHIVKAVRTTQSNDRSVNPSIQLMPAAFEAIIVEKGFENAGIPPSEVPPKIIASGTNRS